MARSQLFSVIAPPDVPPLSHGNATAIRLWNDMDAAVKWPDVLYLFALHEVREPALMLRRLNALRDVMKAPANG